MQNFHLLLATFSILKSSLALPPISDVAEGTCSKLQYRPVDVNEDFANGVSYVIAGNKYLMYSFSSVLPYYDQIRDDQFEFEACYRRNITSNLAELSGFGRPLSIFQKTENGKFLNFLQIDPDDSSNSNQCVISLTDGHSFVFQTCCRTPLDQKEWLVLSKTSRLDENAKNSIKNHAISLGYDWDKAVFLNYQLRCQYGLE